MRTDVQLNVPPEELTRRVRPHGPRGRATDELERFKEVAREFEAVLVEQMVKEMRSGELKSTLFGKDTGMETYRDMLDGEYVRLMTERGGIGLADFMVRNTPRELLGKSVSKGDVEAAKAAGLGQDKASSSAAKRRQFSQTGLPAPALRGMSRRPGD